jgi:hypothetical protein
MLNLYRGSLLFLRNLIIAHFHLAVFVNCGLYIDRIKAFEYPWNDIGIMLIKNFVKQENFYLYRLNKNNNIPRNELKRFFNYFSKSDIDIF